MLSFLYIVGIFVVIHKYNDLAMSLLGSIINLAYPLIRLLHKVTGWTGPRIGYLFLILSVIADAISQHSSEDGITTFWIVWVGIWILVCSWGLEVMHRANKGGHEGTIKINAKHAEHILFVSLFIVLAIPIELWVEVSYSLTTVGKIAGIWETFFDVMVVCCAWGWTPPGKSLWSRVKSKVKESLSSLVPAPVS